MDGLICTQLIDNLQTGVILLDQESRILSWNTWMARHSGLSSSDVTSKRLDELFPEMERSRLKHSIDQALRFRLSSVLAPGLNTAILPLYQKREDRKLDERMQQLVYVTPLRHEQCACLIQILDMTATVRRERRLRAQSTKLIETTFRDALTGIGNRRRFDHDLAEFFAEAQKQQSPLALVMIDVDDFKAYNDHLGHPKGDDCLTAVAAALQDGLRQKGDSLSRYGGEEFALLLPEADRDTACAIAERLRERVESLAIAHPASRTGTSVTVSLGATAIIPTADQLAYILIGQADLALYMAKDAGRNRCMYFDPETGDAHPVR
jgi:diguanylate cyclase (GGDEF)-like protein